MLNIKKIPIGKIKPAAYNPRKNLQPGDPEYEKLLKSIDEFDCVELLVYNRRTGNLVSGHQRLRILAARDDTEVTCSVVDLPLGKEKTLNIALNKIAGTWDNEKLATLLNELIRVPDFDFELTGFELPEASKLIDEILLQRNPEEDDFDFESELEQITKPQTKPGQLIELGPHRILCGDSTKFPNVEKLIGNCKAKLIFLDPPYAQNYRGGAVGKDRTIGKLKNGQRHWDDLSDADYMALLTKALVTHIISPMARRLCIYGLPLQR